MIDIWIQTVSDFAVEYPVYGLWIIVMLGVLHPVVEFPANIIHLTISIFLFGWIGIVVAFGSNVIGILLLYVLVRKVNQTSDYYLEKHHLTSSILDFVKQTSYIKHSIVIGLPLVPTTPIKLVIPFGGAPFKLYVKTLVMAYSILYLFNLLIYYGVLSFFETTLPYGVRFGIVLVIILLIYFGRRILTNIIPIKAKTKTRI